MDELDKKELETIQAEITAIQPRITAVIRTAEEAEEAGKVALLIKSGIKLITDYFTPRKKRAWDSWQDWIKAEKDSLLPWDQIDKINRKGLGDYADAEAAKRREAVEAARLKAEVKAEKQTEKTGVYHAPAPVADAAKVTTTGAKFRTDWKFEIVDASAIPAMFMIPDEKAIRSFVTAKKDKATIAGVRVYSVQTPVI